MMNRTQTRQPGRIDADRVAALATDLRNERYDRLADRAGQFMVDAARLERRHLIRSAAQLVSAAEQRDAAGSVKALVALAQRLDRAA